MRQILMSKPGEFHYENEGDQSRGVAVKMLAKVIQRTKKNEDTDACVVIVSKKPCPVDS
ncbi:hypothetical protein [Pseudoalteromonas gelatinilytica]|uniref:hypothetical protein n=1 Tax=Pseudoalteromonas gelatinilytica TaxID=1703256 RepID=UPI0016039462|nr:hypothetical protein [Pseudoalteromonas profundi]